MDTEVLSMVLPKKENKKKISKIQESLELFERTMEIIGPKPVKNVSVAINNNEITYGNPLKSRKQNAVISRCY